MKLSTYLLISFSTMLALAGCGGSSSTSNPPPPTIGQIYVTLANESQVARFKAGDNGDVSPQGRRNLSPPGPTFIALDVPHDRIAIRSNDGTPAITLLDNVSAISTVNSPGPSLRVITGASTTLGVKIGECALDSTRDLLYVTQDVDSITGIMLVFGPASTIAGDVPPLRSFTMTFHQGGFLLDAANDRVFLSDPVTNAISIFDNASTLTGPVVPARTISGASTQLKAPGDMLLDSSGRLIVSNNPLFLANPQSSTIVVFANAAAATGNIVPSASSAIPQIPFEMAISPAGELYVVDGSPQITVYGGVATAAGAINPIRVITGPNTGLGFFQPSVPALPAGIALDPTR
jgi:hypothetical protein